MTTTTKINVLDFCYPSSGSRYAIDKPKIIGGVLYATDSIVAIRVFDPSTYDGPLNDSEAKFPVIEHVLLGIESAQDWQPWPELQSCESCRDKPVKCLKCSGTGQWDYCPHCYSEDVECQRCEGAGYIACEKCPPLNLGRWFVARKCAMKIKNLPGAMWAEPVRENAPILFRFDGGDGVVCTLGKEGA